MPEIFLRVYGQEIDELIERERLDEAIAHCRYILQTYPKHLETYRLLGKAYLEAKRYGDAADIFQRVLSAIPDDFVSHVGMAIVREDEGNLDAAIWHMERAFETNPSNPAIQQEMKRLINRRDGLEPHKVRLTRGALARMYAHGELFAQAIAELRSALQEDPERPDLQVLLASMYWQTDQRSDATSVSNQILEKLPYCAEANRILAANLQANDRVEEAAVYHRRLANLDPYAAFVESAMADANSVEDSAVSMEKLDWVAGEPLPSAALGQPGWAATLGMEMQEPGEELPEEVRPPQTGPLPSWLEPGEPPPFEAAVEKELRDELETQAAGASSEAGLLDELEAETSDDADSSEPEPEEEDTGPGGLGIAAAAAGVLASGDEDETEELIGEVPPVGEAAVAGAAAEMFDRPEAAEPSDGGPDLAEEEAPSEPEEDLFTGEESEPAGEAVASGELVASDESQGTAEGEIPDWMQEAGWTESSGEVEQAPVSFSDQELQTLDAGQVPADIPEDEDTELAPAELPEWIHDIAPEEDEGSMDEESLPGWIGAEESPEAEGPIEAPNAEFEAAGADGEDEGSFPAADSDTSGLPTWISDDAPGATETIVTWLEDRGPDSPEEGVAESDDVPDWMRDTGPLDEPLDPGVIEEVQDVASSSELQEEEPVGEMPEQPSADARSSESWLSAVAAVAAEEEAGPSSSEGEGLETPDWLSEAKETPDESTSGAVEQGLGLATAGMSAGEEEGEPQSPGASSFAAEADTFDEPGAETIEEDVEAEAPSFSQQAEILEEEAPAETVASGEEAPSLAAEAETIDQSEVSETPSAPGWLEEIGTPPKLPVESASEDWLEGLEIDGEETPAEPASETPEWLKGLAEEGADSEESSAPDWLREIGEPGSVSQEAEGVDAEPQDELAEEPVSGVSSGAPDWIQGTGSITDEEAPAEVEEIPEAAEPEPEAPEVQEDDEVMDWLEDLAAKQAEAPDADEELEAAAQVVAAEPVLEERDIPDEPEEGLEWLEQLADQRGIDVDVSVSGQGAPMASEPEPELEPEPEVDAGPGWLGRMATQPIPDVDIEALEAATRGEEVTADAETIEAQTAEIQAQLDEVALEGEAEGGGLREVAPDDITIKARASDLQAEMEGAAQEAEPVETAPSEIEPKDEIPDWLITAANQAEAPAEAPSSLPEDFAEEPEPEAEDRLSEPSLHSEQDIQVETAAPSGPETLDARVADTDQAAAISEAVSETEEVEEVQPSETEAVGAVEKQEATPEAPAELETAEQVEPLEAEQPADLETSKAEPEEPILEEAPTPEIEKKDDLLERSRHALASGDTQAAAEMYGDLVKRKDSLESVIEDLRIAVDRTPENADLWQVLGDAYMRDDQTDEAIDAYRKGMEAA